MMLKNLMEDKQLDFNQPLLSVRRFSSTGGTSEADEKRKIDKALPKLPPYKSELKSGPVRNPGNVPFIWEQAPGRPKNEMKSQSQAPKRPPITPKLPPGRVANVKEQVSENVSKGTMATQSPTGSILSSSKDVSDFGRRNATTDKSSRQGTEGNTTSASEDDDEAYLDALDTLSRSESFFMNCSVSGVSGFDGPEVKSSGTFSDPQTRDFMMGRFLPAAKAMTSETPQFAPRKQQVVRERPRQVNRVLNGGNWQPLDPYSRLNVLPPYAQEIGREESEDESDDYESSDILSTKVCGLFPRFCIKNSLCVLNPVPGMKMRDQFPVSSVRGMQTKSSYASSCGETKIKNEQRLLGQKQTADVNKDKNELKCKSNKTEGKFGSEKYDQSSLYRHLQGDGVSPHHNGYSQSKLQEQNGFLGIQEKAKDFCGSGFDLHKSARGNFRELLASEKDVASGSPVVEKTLYIDSVHTVKSPSSNSTFSGMKHFIDYRGHDFEIPEKDIEMEDSYSSDASVQDIKHVSVINEKATMMPKSLEFVESFLESASGKSTHEKKTVVKNGSKPDEDIFQDSLAFMSAKENDQENFDLETQHCGKSFAQKKCLDLDRKSITFTNFKVSDNKMDLKSQQYLGLNEQENLHGQIQNSVTLTSSKLDDDRKIDSESQLRKSVIQESPHALNESSKTKVASNGMTDLENQQLVKLGNQESSHSSFMQMPLALLLPKSPSESWLERTLPTVSSRNSSLHPSLDARICSGNPMRSSLDPKWETIVKTSNVQHGRLRFFEDHLSTIPEV